MLFHSLLEPGEAGVFFQQLSWTHRGALDATLCQQAWQRVVDRHGALRAFFVWDNRKEPVQVVCRRAKLPWRNLDWTDKTEEEADEAMRELLAADISEGFDLKRAPLMRCCLIRHSSERHQFVWSFHHALLDGWCLSVIVEEVRRIYDELAGGPPADLPQPAPYRSYLQWLRGKDLSKARQFWTGQLASDRLPTPVTRRDDETPFSGGAYAEMDGRLTESESAALAQQIRRQRLTLNAVLRLLWGIVVGRFSGNQTVVFGATVAGRSSEIEGVERIVGPLLNTVPVRVGVAGGTTLAERARQLLADQMEAEPFGWTPLADLQKWLELEGGTALFDTNLVVENYPINRSLREADHPLTVHDFQARERTNFPLTALVMPGPPLWVRLSYNRALLPDETCRRMMEYFQLLLRAAAQDLNQRIDDLPSLTAGEARALAEWNATRVAYPLDQCLHERISEQADRHPNRAILFFEEETLSYRELETRANRLARHLREQGVEREDLVGVFQERSFDLVVSLLAILKAGAAYVPLDPEYPRQRIEFMIEDAGLRATITTERLRANLPAGSARVIEVDRIRRELESLPDTPLPITVAPENAAYMIYTSGSTGRPKGAVNSHRAICNRLLWMQDALPIDDRDRVLQKTPFSFDVSVWEFFWPLLTGSPMVLAKPGGHQDPIYLAELIARQKVTTLHFVPSMLRLFLEAPNLHRCASLRQVVCSGEALPADTVARFREVMTARLHNLYGPTEAAVDVTWWPAPEAGNGTGVIPIGKPIANIEMRVLDGELRQAPIGVAGELYISGTGLARGYHGRPGLTAERFLPNPLAATPGGRMYRTGDSARYLPEGNIEYLGRLDDQIKIRGFRVELGEIRAVINQHPDVRDSVVTTHGDRSESLRLAAYCVPEAGAQPGVEEIRAWMAAELPEYMTPSAVILLDKIPLLPNGKVDRKSLPAPQPASRATTPAGPASRLEKRIAEVWKSVLTIERVGIDDNFFDLGGNSLLLVSAHYRINEFAPRPLALVDLFACPTIRSLARFLEETSPAIETEPQPPRERKGVGQAQRSRRLAHRSKAQQSQP